MPISKEHFRHEIINLSSCYVLIMANSNYAICPERPCIRLVYKGAEIAHQDESFPLMIQKISVLLNLEEWCTLLGSLNASMKVATLPLKLGYSKLMKY